jgi:hypothetical protein
MAQQHGTTAIIILDFKKEKFLKRETLLVLKQICLFNENYLFLFNQKSLRHIGRFSASEVIT